MKLNKKCGIFGLFSFEKNPKVIYNTILGLESLQHRGREAAGISYIHNNSICIYKNFGLVKEIFTNDVKEKLNIHSHSCIGHTRYSTTKKTTTKDDEFKSIQPLHSVCDLGEFSLVHNGNIPDMKDVIKKLNLQNMETCSDSEIFIKLIIQSNKKSFEERIIDIVKTIPGVYSLIIQTKDALYGIKDSIGIRPLCLSKNDNSFCLSSESTYTGNCDYERELECGEIIKIDNTGVKTIYVKENNTLTFCLFELIYFMRHNSIIYGESVEKYRYQFGYKLGEIEDIIKYGDKNIIVADIPNTAIPSAKGYAKAMNLRYMSIFKKRNGTGRTFILPNNKSRYSTNRRGLIIKEDISSIKSIILVDDSLVRGNTITSIIQKLNNSGITDIHLRITSPPVKHPCYYGIDIPTKEELIASNFTIPEIEQKLGITSLKYLDYNKMTEMFDNNCGCCFTGKYNSKLLEW